MGFFKKKDTVILQKSGLPPTEEQPQPSEVREVRKDRKDTETEETLQEKIKLLKDHIDNIREAFKLREETLQRIIDLMKELKDKQEKQDAIIQRIEDYLKANTDDYAK